MISYIDLKKYLTSLFRSKLADSIDEECDIIISTHNGEITISNLSLKQTYDKFAQYKCDGMELFSSNYREVGILLLNDLSIIDDYATTVYDQENGITYTIGRASDEYSMYLLAKSKDAIDSNLFAKKDVLRSIMPAWHRYVLFSKQHTDKGDEGSNNLSVLFRAYSLIINTDKPVTLKKLRSYADSFLFHFMYHKGLAFSEYTNVCDIQILQKRWRENTKEGSLDMPPRRYYNKAVLDYYSMAMEAEDPFTSYISYYHVIEYYFDEVFKKNLVCEIKDVLTKPGFSYKNDENLYSLAKMIKKHIKSDDESGKGNEFESLKYVLFEYVKIPDLKNRIDELDSLAVAYYQNNTIPFSNSNKVKVGWTDMQGVYTNLATRIYETRNALVHSKSDRADRQYRPYENRQDLKKEIALIRAVAELVIIQSSTIF